MENKYPHLKKWVMLDAAGRLTNNIVSRKHKPKNGRWAEVPSSLGCCDTTTTTTSTSTSTTSSTTTTTTTGA